MKVFHHTEFTIKRKLFGSKKIGLLFDMYAWISIYDAGETTTEKAIYYAAVSYCKEKGKKVSFDQTKINKWLDKITKSEFDNIVKVMQLSSESISEKVKGEKKK